MKRTSMITAIVHWSNGEDDPADPRYSRAHEWHFDGGAKVLASSSPDIVPTPMSDASAVDPEEAFVASISSCHMLWFLSTAAKKGLVVDDYRDEATGEMKRNAAGKLHVATVTLRPVIRWLPGHEPSSDEVSAMHQEAHKECFIANSVKTEIEIE